MKSSSKQFVHGVRYIIYDMEKNGQLAHGMKGILEGYVFNKIDLDIEAVYINIMNGYKIKSMDRCDNIITIYFDCDNSPPFILKYNDYINKVLHG